MVTAEPIRFAVIGDATMDVTVRSPSSPTAGSDHPADISVGPGGQGANLAVRLARQGARVSLLTALADDTEGQELRAALAADGVALVPLRAARSGIVVSFVDDAGERAMLSDRAPFDPAALASPAVQAALDRADWIHVSGYPLADPASGDALAALTGSRGAGRRCSVGGGSFDVGAGMLPRLRTIRPELVLFDRSEAAALLANGSAAAGSDTADGLAARLVSALGGVAVVTDGAAGAAAATISGTVSVPGSPGPAVDTTGAGDAVAAGILVALAGGPWPPPLPALRRALERATRLGAEVAGVVGAQARIPSEA